VTPAVAELLARADELRPRLVELQAETEERTYYSLERIWKDCPPIQLPELSVNPGRTP